VDEKTEARDRAPLSFGADDLVAALTRRLEQAVSPGGARGGVDRSLVVGLFGEWGSGKTTLLRALDDRFAERAEATDAEARSLTLPVFFNAWRYEAEEHLIVPLLKTAERAILDWRKAHQGTGEKAWAWLKERAGDLALSVKALLYGFKGSLAVGELFEIGLDPGASLDKGEELREAREKARRNEIEELASRYYDFHASMRELTGREGKNAERLNLIFLIDDLDRCLPEKAVEMLESIKLFLEVEGCAFVVAVDDEVVARGIEHRYRDYKVGGQGAWDSVAHSLHPSRFQSYQETRGPLPQAPITGSEYLEKIVHLPLRIPQPTATAVEEFLAARYPDLFDAEEAGKQESAVPEEAETGEVDALTASSRRPEALGDRGRGNEAERRRTLLRIFVACVPAVPRKLVRAAELFRVLRDLAHARDWKEIDEPTLARMVFLQLFAPRIYRFGRRQPVFFSVLERWFGASRQRTFDELEKEIGGVKEAVEGEETGRDSPYLLDTLEKPLLALLREVARNRSGFAPRNLVLSDLPADQGLHRYYHLLDTDRVARAAAAAPGDDLEPARLEEPAAFLTQWSGSDPLAWRNALEQEGERLAGRRLDDATFSALAAGSVGWPPEEALHRLTLLEPHLSPAQMLEIYRAADLLPRLAKDLEKEAS